MQALGQDRAPDLDLSGVRNLILAAGPSVVRQKFLNSVPGSFLMAAHLAEVLVWSLAYAIVDAAPEGSDLVDFAFVNYTTLGYGDVLPVARWRLLGPMTAMNGVLMFGWSTAVIFEVLQRAIVTIRGQDTTSGTSHE